MKKYSLYLLISLPLTVALIAIAGILTANKNLLIEVLVRLLVIAYTTLLVPIVDVVLYLLALKKFLRLPYTFGFFYMTFISVALGIIFLLITITEGLGEWGYTMGGILAVVCSILMVKKLPSPKNI